MFQTEFEFTLPCGYLDETARCIATGVMRRATAADEILPLRDPRVAKNPAYLVVILLSRVVTRLGGVARDQSQGDREPVRRGPGLSAGPLQPDQPAGRRRAHERSARSAGTSSDAEAAAVGESRLPPRSADRGGSLHRLSLSLAARARSCNMEHADRRQWVARDFRPSTGDERGE